MPEVKVFATMQACIHACMVAIRSLISMELLLQAVPVKRGLKRTQKSYAAMLTFGDVVRLIDDARLYVPNDPNLTDFAQRKLNPVRVRANAYSNDEGYSS